MTGHGKAKREGWKEKADREQKPAQSGSAKSGKIRKSGESEARGQTRRGTRDRKTTKNTPQEENAGSASVRPQTAGSQTRRPGAEARCQCATKARDRNDL
jgi:hypothetical protein